MKRKIHYLIGLLLIFSNFGLSAQVTTEQFNAKAFVYWIYIRAEKKFDSELKRPIYVVRVLSKTPKSGTVDAFEKDLWKCRLAGQQLAVGPFLEYNDAKRAIAIYDIAKLPKEKMEKEIANFKDSTITKDEFYWYYVKFDITQRTHKYEFERIPARVAPGAIKEFVSVFTEGVTMEMLNFGPFPSQSEAEESKRLNRLEEK
jgi:hypothetical protein